MSHGQSDSIAKADPPFSIYRYFSTNNRKFIIADTPGHEQYTRNKMCIRDSSDSTSEYRYSGFQINPWFLFRLDIGTGSHPDGIIQVVIADTSGPSP